MVEFYYNNFNFCEGYYSPKLLATLRSNLQIMSVLFSCKLVSLNIWVANRSTFLCVLGRKHYEENFTFTRLNNLENDSKKKWKNQKLTRFLSGCSFFHAFCQYLQVDSYSRTKNFTNTCKHIRFCQIFISFWFCEHPHVCWSNLTCQVAVPSKDRARNGNESTLVSLHFFTSYYPE